MTAIGRTGVIGPTAAPTADAGVRAVVVEIGIRCESGYEPEYASPHAAGADLRARLPGLLEIPPGGRASIPTGVRIAIPEGFEGQVRPRSGLAARHGVTIANAPGTIDSDYRGELHVLLLNTAAEPYTVRDRDRIAQLVIAPVVRAAFEQRDLGRTERGEGGFGSTGR